MTEQESRQNRVYDTEAIRELLLKAFDDEEFTVLCYDHFRPAYEEFSGGQSRSTKIHILIEYCERHFLLEELLNAVREKNPSQFEQLRPRLYKVYTPATVPGNAWQDRERLRIENLTQKEEKEYELLYLDSLISWVDRLWREEGLKEERIFDDVSVRERNVEEGMLGSEGFLFGKRFRKVRRRRGSVIYGPETLEQPDESIAEGPVVSLNEVLKDAVGGKLRLVDPPKKRLYALLGEPGCGKTTAIRKLACEAARWVAKSRRRRLLPGLVDRPIPVIVDLRYYHQTDPLDKDKPIPFDQFLCEYLEKRHNKDIPDEAIFMAANLDKYLKEPGALLLLLDSMNEMPREDFSKRVDEIQKFLSSKQNRCRAILVCRSRHWDEPILEMTEREMLPLDVKQIREFIAMQIPDDNAAQDLFDSLDAKWLRLCRNPQRLQVLIDVCYDRSSGGVRNPPGTMAELFEAFTEKLISDEMRRAKESGRPVPFSVADVISALSALGFAMTRDVGKGTLLVNWNWALERLSIPLLEDILDFACKARILCGPTQPGDRARDEDDQRRHVEVRFTHQLFQEYFASRELERYLSKIDPSSLLREFWWEETVLLLADTVGNPDELVHKILRAQTPPNSYTLRLAAECIARRKEDHSREVIEEVRDALGHLLERHRGGVKASAIIALGYLDDAESVDLIYSQLKGYRRWIKEVALATLENMENKAAWEVLQEYYTSTEGIFLFRRVREYAKRRGGLDAFLLQTKQIARALLMLLYALLWPVVCLVAYLWSKYQPLSSMLPTPTPTPTPAPISTTGDEFCTGALPVCSMGLVVLLIVVGIRSVAMPREHLKEFRLERKLQLPLENYMGALWAPIFLGVSIGYFALAIWGAREGRFPFSTVQALLIPLCIAVYSFYLDWAWATVRWFFDQRKEGQSPADELSFSISGTIFTAHLAIALVVVIRAVFLIRLDALSVILSSVLFLGGVFDTAQRLSLLSV